MVTAASREAALELVDELIECLEATARALTAASDSLPGWNRFAAYHLADLEGAEGGWLGGPHLIDALRDMRRVAPVSADE